METSISGHRLIPLIPRLLQNLLIVLITKQSIINLQVVTKFNNM